MKAVSYVRVSTEEQAKEGQSLEFQEEVNREYALSNGIELVKVFVEAGSAYRYDSRDEFAKMCNYLEQNPDINAIIVWKTIRAVRNLSEWGYLTEQLRGGKGVKILSVTEGFPTTPAGQLMGGISAAFGRWQSNVISEQASAGMLRKAQMNVYPSKSPIGYINVKRDYPKQRGLGHTIDPVMGSKVKELFELAATGEYSIRQLRVHAEHIGLRTMNSSTPSKCMIHKMLNNHFYIGKFTWKGIVYQGNHEPLISLDVWNAVQDPLAARRKYTPRANKQFALKGLVTCPQGNPMTAQRQNNRYGTEYTYYFCRKDSHVQCGRNFNEKHLFSWGETLLEPLALRQEVKEFILKAFEIWHRKHQGNSVETIEHYQSKLATIQRRQDTALDLYIDGRLDEDTWKRKQENLRQEAAQITRSIALQKRTQLITHDQAQSALDFISDLKQRYCTAKRLDKGRILKAVFSNLILGGENPVPVYKSGFDLLLRPLWCTQEDEVPTFLPVIIQDVEEAMKYINDVPKLFNR